MIFKAKENWSLKKSFLFVTSMATSYSVGLGSVFEREWIFLEQVGINCPYTPKIISKFSFEHVSTRLTTEGYTATILTMEPLDWNKSTHPKRKFPKVGWIRKNRDQRKATRKNLLRMENSIEQWDTDTFWSWPSTYFLNVQLYRTVK